ncbi:branched-chain amino acid ABC transporter permease [Rhodovarius crocodyli]|uniref:Branched-chain amino acid ABC transporter permease n=1 Tax=Rhodovarius crocodyli TaxID=1979269 RepID=A0A437LW71_9PROT|nr:branched-chain amino acid ABC transporter permease [Rhodovarius crocodyli]
MAAPASGSFEALAAENEALWGFTKPQLIALGLMLVGILVAPAILYPIFLMKVLCFALFACAFNLLIGYVGLLSFGHAAYFGMGGYLAGHAAKAWGLTPEASILMGGLAGMLLGWVIGWLAIRRQGIYFAMITLAMAQMVYFFCVQAPFTGGEDGIQAIPRGRLFGMIDLSADTTMYWLVAGVFVAGFLFIHRVIHSPFGQVMTAIRENEPRATSLGYRAEHYKLMAFVISAALSGVAGATKALVFGIATLTDVFWTMSGEVVLMSLVGGLGTLFGPVAGAAIIITMQNYLAEYGAWVTVIQGIIFVLCVLVFRRGVVGEIGRFLKVRL